VQELPVQDLLDRAQLAAVARWPGASIIDLEPLQGGISSLTFTARLAGAGIGTGTGIGIGIGADDGGGDGDRRLVIKVAPPGLAPVRNRDVLRQARVMRAVHDAPGVRVPAVLLEDGGSPPFFVMEFVEGEAYEPKWNVSERPPTPELVDRRARAAAMMLARLQEIEPAAAGLADEPALTLAQELERWTRLFATAGDDLRGDELSLQAALAARIPAPVAPRVLHGDYRLGNMQFAGDRLAAIIDWELWSLGDPRTDLAWLLAFTDPVLRRVAKRDDANQAAADAMPGRDELLGEYLHASGAGAGAGEPANLSWFLAFCFYKLGATMSVLVKRNRRLPEPDPGLELAATTLAPMLAHGLEIIRAAAWGR
jgi:aminoglycoside phosphotransferase (APT) family kinase protein